MQSFARSIISADSAFSMRPSPGPVGVMLSTSSPAISRGHVCSSWTITQEPLPSEAWHTMMSWWSWSGAAV